MHEVRITNQIMYLYPSVDEARVHILQQLYAWQAIVTSQTRLQSTRYQVIEFIYGIVHNHHQISEKERRGLTLDALSLIAKMSLLVYDRISYPIIGTIGFPAFHDMGFFL